MDGWSLDALLLWPRLQPDFSKDEETGPPCTGWLHLQELSKGEAFERFEAWPDGFQHVSTVSSVVFSMFFFPLLWSSEPIYWILLVDTWCLFVFEWHHMCEVDVKLVEVCDVWIYIRLC